ncbi:hypothetical protein L2E82_24973 [Cichorium intybus]|uniref:Uncharacterized protein n=1 Tax=Cichorium intybus TaxID=13427 RepID=A0ACB9E2I0_CICIN|nr:hypothetical protein L2E82_24973 [Cichorium intybus]
MLKAVEFISQMEGLKNTCALRANLLFCLILRDYLLKLYPLQSILQTSQHPRLPSSESPVFSHRPPNDDELLKKQTIDRMQASIIHDKAIAAAIVMDLREMVSVAVGNHYGFDPKSEDGEAVERWVFDPSSVCRCHNNKDIGENGDKDKEGSRRWDSVFQENVRNAIKWFEDYMTGYRKYQMKDDEPKKDDFSDAVVKIEGEVINRDSKLAIQNEIGNADKSISLKLMSRNVLFLY